MTRTTRLLAGLLPASALLVLAALPCSAREVLTPEEQTERERERKRQAQPVLVCSPESLSASVTRGDTRRLRLTIRNAGGRTLGWVTTFWPNWAKLTTDSGELGFQKEQVVYVTVDTTRLPAGRTRGRIVIEAPGAAGSPVTVLIVVEVRSVATRPPAPPKREPVPRPATAPRAETPSAPARQRDNRFGVKAGLMSPHVGYGEALFLGFYYRRTPADHRGVSYELGLDIGGSAGNPGYETRPGGVRFDALFPIGDQGRGARGYLLGGGTFFVEFVHSEATGGDFTNYALAGNLGGGVAFGGERFDVRLVHCLLLGSGNADGVTVFSVGFSF